MNNKSNIIHKIMLTSAFVGGVSVSPSMECFAGVATAATCCLGGLCALSYVAGKALEEHSQVIEACHNSHEYREARLKNYKNAKDGRVWIDRLPKPEKRQVFIDYEINRALIHESSVRTEVLRILQEPFPTQEDLDKALQKLFISHVDLPHYVLINILHEGMEITEALFAPPEFKPSIREQVIKYVGKRRAI